MDKLDDVRAVFEKLYKEQTIFIENTHGYDSQKFSLWAGFQLGWQASRESLEVELPTKEPNPSQNNSYAFGYNRAITEATELLNRQGVKIKNE
ncbi:hypothetical protein RG265_003358 [Providencia stuartii]